MTEEEDVTPDGLGEQFTGTNRFRLASKLGQGGMGAVYRAYDQERKEWVALKTLLSVDPTALYHFKREFRTLADVSHPNLVTLYELEANAGKWFLTMELVEGVDLLTYVRHWGLGAQLSHGVSPDSVTAALSSYPDQGGRASDESPSAAIPVESVSHPTLAGGSSRVAPGAINRIRPVFAQLAGALTAIHESGHLHRDIKPSNVLVTEQGRVVVLDFGLMSGLERYAPAFQGGTRAYLAPEAYTSGRSSHATDWYAFGTMLYEALVGRRPFADPMVRGIALEQLKRTGTLAPPSSQRHGVPEDLDGLCTDLLRPDPEARPTGDEVLRRLGIDADALVADGSRQSMSHPGSLVGRHRALYMLRMRYAEVQRGGGRIVLLHGQSGMGKSTLSRRFLAGLEDAVILEGRCYERENVPYKALDSLIDTLFAFLLHAGPRAVEQLVPTELSALTQVFPVLCQVEVFAKVLAAQSDRVPIPEPRQRAFLALRDLIARIAKNRPVVVFIDDLHWGDAESAPMFIELMREPTPRVLLLGTYRTDDVEDSPLLGLLMQQEQRHLQSRLTTIEMGELTLDQSLDLARELLSEAKQDEAVRVAREAEGNPYFIHELARYVDDGRLEKSGEMSLATAILSRVDALSPAARRLLEVVAVAGRRLPQDIAHQAAASGSGQRVLAELRAAHLVRTTGSGSQAEVEPAHEPVREAVTEAMGPEQLRSCHRRIAESMEQLPDLPRDHIFALAQHSYLGGARETGPRVVELCYQAGRLAAEAYAFEQAYEYLAWAAETAAENDATLDADFDQLFADVAAATGRVEQAVVYCQRALERSGRREQQAALHHSLSKIHISAMDPERGLSEAVAGLRQLGKPLRSGLGEVLSALWAWWRGRGVERDPRQFGKASGELGRRCELEIGLHQYAALSCFFALRPLGMVTHCLRMYRPAALLGLSPHYLDLYLSLAAMSAARRFRWTERLIERTEDLARELDHRPTTARARMYMSVAKHFLGKTVEAEHSARIVLSHHDRWLENVDYFSLVGDLSWNLLMRGYPAQGWAWVQQGLQRATLSGDANILVQGHTYRCYAAPLLTMCGDFAAGAHHLEQFRATLRTPAQDPWRWCQYLGHLTMSLVLQGRHGEELEGTIARYDRLGISLRRAPLQLCHFFVARAYARLWEYQRAGPSERGHKRVQLKRALALLAKTLGHETLICHRRVIEAEFWRQEGKAARSLSCLLKAERLAQETDNRWVMAESTLIRAKMTRARGDAREAARLWRQALAFYDEVGWTARASWLRDSRE